MGLCIPGASLAQDRGRLEARIEALGAEVETRKKQNERDGDALKIKAKVVDDQTESIRKLKEVAGLRLMTQTIQHVQVKGHVPSFLPHVPVVEGPAGA